MDQEQEVQRVYTPLLLTGRQLRWTGAAVAVLAIAILIGYPFGITLWDWIKLLVVPAVLAVGGVLLSQLQQRRDRESADRRAQDDALEAYLDDMTDLMTVHHLRSPPQGEDPEDLRAVARARTLTLLRRLDGERKAHVVQFLYESGLIITNRTVVDLHGADLSGAYLSGANLSGANLSGAHLDYAHLQGASLDDSMPVSGERLMNGSRVSGARKVKASVADLENTSLCGAHLEGASLLYAHLHNANLKGANLSGANLSGAEGWTGDQLSEAVSLEGAAMPGGQILKSDETPNGPTFEEWLKDREDRQKRRKEDGENE